MIVTLRKFLEIAQDIISPYICIVYLEYEHEDWGTDTKKLFNPFGTPYDGERKYVGMKFMVLGRVKEITEDKDGADLECLPMWNIQFENGDTMAAYPEEICLAERKV